jgi:hypothetical protein
MARLIERSFDPNRPVKVRRFFVAAGRHWEPGRAFPWKNMAIAQRRVKLLFDAGKLLHPETEEVFEATPEPTIAQEMQDEDIQHIAVSDEQPAAEPVDELDGLTMPELRAIAEEEGAPTRVSRQAQREAIREHRLAGKTE